METKKVEMKKCPHNDLRFCPLYIAAHEPFGDGCLDGQEGYDNGCAVDRGLLNYDAAVKRVRDRDPVMVGQCEWKELKVAHGIAH